MEAMQEKVREIVRILDTDSNGKMSPEEARSFVAALSGISIDKIGTLLVV